MCLRFDAPQRFIGLNYNDAAMHVPADVYNRNECNLFAVAFGKHNNN